MQGADEERESESIHEPRGIAQTRGGQTDCSDGLGIAHELVRGAIALVRCRPEHAYSFFELAPTGEIDGRDDVTGGIGIRRRRGGQAYFFFNDTATTEIYTSDWCKDAYAA